MHKVKVALNVVMTVTSIVSAVCGIIVKGADLASEIRSK